MITRLHWSSCNQCEWRSGLHNPSFFSLFSFSFFCFSFLFFFFYIYFFLFFYIFYFFFSFFLFAFGFFRKKVWGTKKFKKNRRKKLSGLTILLKKKWGYLKFLWRISRFFDKNSEKNLGVTKVLEFLLFCDHWLKNKENSLLMSSRQKSVIDLK